MKVLIEFDCKFGELEVEDRLLLILPNNHEKALFISNLLRPYIEEMLALSSDGEFKDEHRI